MISVHREVVKPRPIFGRKTRKKKIAHRLLTVKYAQYIQSFLESSLMIRKKVTIHESAALLVL